MSYIHVTTFMEAPAERVFHLSRSIRLHKLAMKEVQAEVIQQPSGALIGPGESVSWKAKLLFRMRLWKLKVTSFQEPFSFVEEQVQGDLKTMKHEHFFKPVENGTIMIDQFHYTLRYGNLGNLVNSIYLRKYLQRMLEERNRLIKKVAEGNDGNKYLEQY